MSDIQSKWQEWTSQVIDDRDKADSKANCSLHEEPDVEVTLARFLYEKNVKTTDSLMKTIELMKNDQGTDSHFVAEKLEEYTKVYMNQCDQYGSFIMNDPLFERQRFYDGITLDNYDKNKIWLNYISNKSRNEYKSLSKIHRYMIQYYKSTDVKSIVATPNNDVMAIGDSCWTLKSPTSNLLKPLFRLVDECLTRNERLISIYNNKDDQVKKIRSEDVDQWEVHSAEIDKYLNLVSSFHPVEDYTEYKLKCNQQGLAYLKSILDNLKAVSDKKTALQTVNKGKKEILAYLEEEKEIIEKIKKAKECWKEKYLKYLKSRHIYQWMQLADKQNQASLNNVNAFKGDKNNEDFKSLDEYIRKVRRSLESNRIGVDDELENEHNKCMTEFKMAQSSILDLLLKEDLHRFLHMVHNILYEKISNSSSGFLSLSVADWRLEITNACKDIEENSLKSPDHSVMCTSFRSLFTECILNPYNKFKTESASTVNGLKAKINNEKVFVDRLLNSSHKTVSDIERGVGSYSLLTEDDLKSSHSIASKSIVPKEWMEKLVKSLEANSNRVKLLLQKEDQPKVNGKRNREEMENKIAKECQLDVLKRVIKAVDSQNSVPVSFGCVCEFIQRLHVVTLRSKF